MRNGSSRRDLLLNSQNFFRSIPAGAENPSLSRLCCRRLWGSRNRRALIFTLLYNMKKEGSKFSPRTVVLPIEKIMKEAIRMVLESIYDPEFPDTSHFNENEARPHFLNKSTTCTTNKRRSLPTLP
ncbi:hypothetical protein RIF29_14204 [Crotalaria pallida]|uniref:Uncharacterized protein n=1 Tax=Crotalaria pallida TaxID=3830 RepID=A0AAN9FDF0_CROPI